MRNTGVGCRRKAGCWVEEAAFLGPQAEAGIVAGPGMAFRGGAAPAARGGAGRKRLVAGAGVEGPGGGPMRGSGPFVGSGPSAWEGARTCWKMRRGASGRRDWCWRGFSRGRRSPGPRGSTTRWCSSSRVRTPAKAVQGVVARWNGQVTPLPAEAMHGLWVLPGTSRPTRGSLSWLVGVLPTAEFTANVEQLAGMAAAAEVCPDAIRILLKHSLTPGVELQRLRLLVSLAVKPLTGPQHSESLAAAEAVLAAIELVDPETASHGRARGGPLRATRPGGGAAPGGGAGRVRGRPGARRGQDRGGPHA